MGFYVYSHKKADTGVIFYIGKGKGNRLNFKHGRSAYWNRIVAKHGFKAEIIINFETEQEAFKYEILLIEGFKASELSLCNLTRGGEGMSGYKHSKEAKEKISVARNNMSEETRIKIGDASRKRSKESRAKMSAAKIGKVVSEETKAKMKNAAKNKILSEEHKINIGAARKGKPWSEARRATYNVNKTKEKL